MPGPGSHTFLNRINTFGVKIRPVLKKIDNKEENLKLLSFKGSLKG